MKTNKILVILVVVLILVNIGTLSFIWFGKSDKKKEANRSRHPQVERFLKKRLKLTEDQAKLFSEAREKHFANSEPLMSKMKDYRSQILASSADSLTVDSLLLKIAETQRQIERLNLEHMRKLKSYCSPEQQKAFDSVMVSIFERQGSPHRRLRKRRNKK